MQQLHLDDGCIDAHVLDAIIGISCRRTRFTSQHRDDSTEGRNTVQVTLVSRKARSCEPRNLLLVVQLYNNTLSMDLSRIESRILLDENEHKYVIATPLGRFLLRMGRSCEVNTVNETSLAPKYRIGL